MAPLAKYVTAALAARNPHHTNLQKRFSYHDNGVTFKLSNDIQSSWGALLTSGQFRVTDMSITDGQDRDHRNNIGDVKSFSSKLVFSVGRHKSDQVAGWWNPKMGGNKNTFNHDADKLNFAFLGDLTLTISAVSGAITMTLPQVGLAQGSAGASNNWWFGGPQCTYTGQHIVSCPGADSNGNGLTASFDRGDALGSIFSSIGSSPFQVGMMAAPMVLRKRDKDDVDEIIITNIAYNQQPQVAAAAPSAAADTAAQDPNAQAAPAQDPNAQAAPAQDPAQDAAAQNVAVPDPNAQPAATPDPDAQNPPPQNPPTQDPNAQNPPPQDPATRNSPAQDPNTQNPPVPDTAKDAATQPTAQAAASQDPTAQVATSQDSTSQQTAAQPAMSQPPAAHSRMCDSDKVDSLIDAIIQQAIKSGQTDKLGESIDKVYQAINKQCGGVINEVSDASAAQTAAESSTPQPSEVAAAAELVE